MKRSNTFKIIIPAELQHLSQVLNTVGAFARQAGATEEKLGQIELVLEELLVNIINYAYPEGQGTIEIRYRHSHQARLRLEIFDRGIPFDPLSIPEVDTQLPLDDRPIGGLGIFLIRNMVESIHYRRENDKNVLTVYISLNAE
ncbi:putative anti-sigma regulatory factor, serine/threonine protein kinase [Candidatus Vecturithrix granuli]|uniref:Putative anti-sigma regulatory factor, serine/threonine protein kinase n=1 Tax=Vecturithrix granuli TaxID=1499967 RepID=A0A081C3N0_VECG1|nr:putative anti-sigma regulatory factor, serine/threonine protein kinase [Candidatus Vecturithrix granuli]